MNHLVWIFALGAAVASGCGGQQAQVLEPSTSHTKEEPPEPSPPKDVSLPKPTRSTLSNGLEVNVSTAEQLPLVYARLVIRSGGETDPPSLPGLSSLVASMLKEGTKTRSSAELAEQIEFLGTDLWAHADEEQLEIGVQALSEHFEEALSLLADVALRPAFDQGELEKLKRRELDRLSRAEREPSYLARRAFYATLYGEHPYASIDTTEKAIEKLTRKDLVRWHRQHVVAKNAFVVVVGDVTNEQVRQTAQKVLGSWTSGELIVPSYASPPVRGERTILVIDRPGSVQSVIYIGNLAIPRNHPDWIPLTVANQVLGGSAASRLFMDLREARSLTYGAYSAVAERVRVGPFVAYASVRTEVTKVAVDAFFEHLNQIVKERASDTELVNARRFLSDSFALDIDTAGKVASSQAHLRSFGLPDDYWQKFRTNIRAVDAREALAAARAHMLPDKALVVIVGQAADFAESLRSFGPVTVIAPSGEVKAKFEAADAE